MWHFVCLKVIGRLNVVLSGGPGVGKSGDLLLIVLRHDPSISRQGIPVGFKVPLISRHVTCKKRFWVPGVVQSQG